LIWFGFDFNGTGDYRLERQYKKQRTKKLSKPVNARLIAGIVSDATGPLPGANVVVNGTERGVQTDVDGYYEIEAAPGEELTFSFVGMYENTIAVGTEKKVDVTLDQGATLNEVVVEGYSGATKKKASIAQTTVEITQEDDNVFLALSGTAAGIDVRRDQAGNAINVVLRGVSSMSGSSNPLYVVDGVIMSSADVAHLSASDLQSASLIKGISAVALYGSKASNGVFVITTKKAVEELSVVKLRKDMSETAFFFPNLKVGADGKLALNFTSPEALTQWKLRLFAHNQKAATGYLERLVTTQKDLMITPNFPRFFREKDSITISCKISNLTAAAKSGSAILQLSDAVTMLSVDAAAMNAENIRQFNVPAFKSATVSWKIAIPEAIQGMQYKIAAKSGNFSDGEENIIPVLANDILVTESIPIWVRDKSKKQYTFENLRSSSSPTLRNHQLTLEYTSNPTWFAIESLPYLMEYFAMAELEEQKAIPSDAVFLPGHSGDFLGGSY
ncbi:MAG: alpha-2-macroglobulin, partial [Flavobacterium sp.]